MSDIPDKQKLELAKMKKAYKLAQDGQYDKARYLLQQIDHPKATEFLKVLANKTEKRKAKSSVSPFSVIIVVFVVLAIGGAIGGALWFQSYFGQFSLSDIAGASGGNLDFNSEMSEEDEALFDLLFYCYDYTGYEGECSDWAERAANNHLNEVTACFAPYDSQFAMSIADNLAVGDCLTAAGISTPR